MSFTPVSEIQRKEGEVGQSSEYIHDQIVAGFAETLQALEDAGLVCFGNVPSGAPKGSIIGYWRDEEKRERAPTDPDIRLMYDGHVLTEVRVLGRVVYDYYSHDSIWHETLYYPHATDGDLGRWEIQNGSDGSTYLIEAVAVGGSRREGPNFNAFYDLVYSDGASIFQYRGLYACDGERLLSQGNEEKLVLAHPQPVDTGSLIEYATRSAFMLFDRNEGVIALGPRPVLLSREGLRRLKRIEDYRSRDRRVTWIEDYRSWDRGVTWIEDYRSWDRRVTLYQAGDENSFVVIHGDSGDGVSVHDLTIMSRSISVDYPEPGKAEIHVSATVACDGSESVVNGVMPYSLGKGQNEISEKTVALAPIRLAIKTLFQES